ncbi:hypothetical protein [Pseudomonas fragi]|uniref:hypothetical protein n=1 Tax=Pseudomonas fragi TaxID=296 RepID=UPI0014740EE3|nr:hypothetical protein [Pseudomonas fragi]NNB33814.1 hypothetical protein [Pseudomonas fragi]
MMILLEKRTRLAVNPDDVSSMSIHKSNGYSVLEVKMISGEKYRVRDTSHCFDGDDVHTLHKQLLEAM